MEVPIISTKAQSSNSKRRVLIRTITIVLYLKVTDKTRADIKGGTLIQYEGKVKFSMMQWLTSMYEETH